MKPLLNVVSTCMLLVHSGIVHAQQLVLRGDYPDPSVIKVGETYWASATTSNWAPVYPLVKSKDLKNWETVGHIFRELPDWADYYFWAPELNYDSGKVYVYYSAHKKGGNLCVAVASADRPEGPYRDHGPLICQQVGSIDAFPMRDENGKLHIVWKEDANSVGKPTPIWISEMNEERTKLIGERKELFRNDQPWEANLVEGVSMIRNGEYYYAFYAAAGCCGAACTYGVGVARAKSLMGPWEKYAKNPIMSHSDKWKCPGHGTPVEKGGKHYFMYHAYETGSTVFTGRQGLLIEYRFTDDGWIEFVEDAAQPSSPVMDIKDDFDSTDLGADWQWSVFDKPRFETGEGVLYMDARDSAAGSMLGHKIVSADYEAVAVIDRKASNAKTGIAVIGDENNIISALLDGSSLVLIQRREGRNSILARATGLRQSDDLWVMVKSYGGKTLQFFYKTGEGRTPGILNKVPVDASFLPPWDRAVRVGLVSKGSSGGSVVKQFAINYGRQ
jgi:xylan 1,4-beta-xylosidase